MGERNKVGFHVEMSRPTSHAIRSTDKARGLVFTSWNVKGMNHPIKRGKVLSHLKSLNSDIMFLQETHLKNDAHSRLRSNWIGHIYHSTFSSKARGAAILIRKGIHFKHKSTIADRDGRYVIVTGEINSTPVTLVNIYGPNFDNPSFFQKVFSLIPDLSLTSLIIGADLNCAIDPYLDRSSTQRAPPSKTRDFLKSYINNSNICDLWRMFNPSGRDYSFHSSVHNVYTRIDYFLVDKKLIPYILSTKYHNILISDHSPVTFCIDLNNTSSPNPTWRLDPQLLSDPAFKAYLSREIKTFFDINNTPNISPSLLWETFKAYLRGCVISFKGQRNKQNKIMLQEIEKELHQLDNENATSPSSNTHKKILKLRYKYNQIISQRLSTKFMYIKQRYFEFGDKPHKLLARQLRKIENDRSIHKIKSDSGVPLTLPKDINDRFKQFYEKLYSSKNNEDPACIEAFLNKCNLPILTQEDRDFLGADITVEEINKTIKSLKTGKTPGPDGIPAEIYKNFKELTPFMHNMFTQSQEEGLLPPSLYDAIITVIPKKGKDPEEVGGYRPISLINVDQKILAKTLANRLNTLLGKLIATDQTGFVPERSAFSNLRRLFNILYSSHTSKTDLVVMSLDAEKAFDQVQWPYLFAVLKKFDMGDAFIAWIKTLYKNPKAQILTNKTLSSPFQLQRGTRQGCPLSPLLFALVIEPLAETIRSETNIHGFNCRTTSHKISLFADDVLIYATKPLSSIPVILHIIDNFSSFSGYRINWGKSELMPVGLIDPSQLSHLPFKISKDKFIYLGIVVTKLPKALFAANYPPLLEKLKSNIQFWRTLPISLIGRVSTIKMIFLPQLLYLLQNIPVFLPKAFFKQLDSLIMPFIWHYKNHRIRKAHLCKPRSEGGLALPSFQLYYWACSLRVIALLLFNNDNEHQAWMELEKDQCTPYDLTSIILSPTVLKKSFYRNNFIIHSTFRVWKQIKTAFNANSLSFLLPITNNPSFLPSTMDNGFKHWKDVGIKRIGNLYLNGKFATFTEIQETYGLNKNNFFRFLQIRNYVQTHSEDFATASPSCLDKCLRHSKSISSFYYSLQNLDLPSTSAIKEAWEEELGLEISDGDWKTSLEEIQHCSINARHCLIQFKILHRLHYSKTKLHKIFPNISPNCDKCGSGEGSLAHCFVLCPNLQGYWQGIFKVFTEVTQKPLEPDALLILMGWSDQSYKLTTHEQQFVSYGLLTAKKLILTFWKKQQVPSLQAWLNELTNTLHPEEIRFSLRDRTRNFEKIWDPFVHYLDANRPIHVTN